MKILAHVDDFLVMGEKAQCEALLKDLKKDFEVEGDIVGLDSGEVSEVTKVWSNHSCNSDRLGDRGRQEVSD